jgi:hypothetical protein
VLRFVFRSLALADFNFRLVRRVCMYEASVSAAVHMILFGEVVLVNESLSHARNADKNALWISFFSFALCQWPIPRIAFQLGSFPGTVSFIVIRAWSRRRALRARAANVMLRAAVAQAGVGWQLSHFAPPLFFGADFNM